LSVIGEGDDPLLYLRAIGDAVSGLESARVTLALARQRLGDARRRATGQARGAGGMPSAPRFRQTAFQERPVLLATSAAGRVPAS
jgi:hypothetical protein